MLFQKIDGPNSNEMSDISKVDSIDQALYNRSVD